MGSGLFSIGISGLYAAQAGLVTTGHNISNASTPGFHRQEVVQSNATPQLTGAGFIGSGVEVNTVRRVYSDFLDGQAMRAQSQASYYTTFNDQISQIDNVLSDPNAGLAPELESFFAGVHELAAHPNSVPSRQALLAAGQSLTARFQALDNRFIEMNRGVNAQIDSTVSQINTYAKQISELNLRIAGARADPNQQPNDLLDKRDELVAQLGSLVGASSVVQSDGNMTVTIGNGQSLVVGTQAFKLTTLPSVEVPEQTDVGYIAGNSTVTLQPATLSGGSLGALLAFRASALTESRNELGRVAASIAESFNSQHVLGQDLNGALGTNFFTPPVGSATASSANTGTGVVNVSITSSSALKASDYRLVNTGGSYQLTRISDGKITNYATLPQTVDGITIALGSGTVNSGDSFYIEPTRYTSRNLSVAISDPTQIAAAAPMRTGAGSGNMGTGLVSPGVVNTPINANLQQPVTITFTSATTFDVTGTGTGNPTGVTFTAGQPITYNGWTVSITGAPQSGDTFTVGPNTNGVSDNRNASLLADLQSKAILSGNTATFQQTYAQLASSVGSQTRDMQIAADAQEAIATRAKETQQSMSGVNLDEEAANLMRYQQAYQAAGKVIEVASTLFDTILNIRS